MASGIVTLGIGPPTPNVYMFTTSGLFTSIATVVTVAASVRGPRSSGSVSGMGSSKTLFGPQSSAGVVGMDETGEVTGPQSTGELSYGIA